MRCTCSLHVGRAIRTTPGLTSIHLIKCAYRCECLCPQSQTWEKLIRCISLNSLVTRFKGENHLHTDWEGGGQWVQKNKILARRNTAHYLKSTNKKVLPPVWGERWNVCVCMWGKKDSKCLRDDATPLWDFLTSAPSIKPILPSPPNLRFKFLGLLNTETNTLKGESLWTWK